MTTKMTDDHDDDDDIVCVCFQACVCVVLQHWSPSALVPIGSGPTIGGPHHLLEIPSSAVGLFITSDPHHQQRSHHQQWSNHPIFLHANTHTDTHTHAHTLLLSSSSSSSSSSSASSSSTPDPHPPDDGGGWSPRMVVLVVQGECAPRSSAA